VLTGAVTNLKQFLKKQGEKENKVFSQSCVKAALNRGIQEETKHGRPPAF